MVPSGHVHADAPSPPDPRPLTGYGVIIATYGAVAGMLVAGLRHRRRDVRRLTVMDLLLLGLATEHLSTLVTKDSVTAILRAPFTEFEEPAGEGEVNERAAGTGLRRAVGELLTCPFCVAQWVATALVAGNVAAPDLTTAVVSICATARLSDYLQIAYGVIRERQ